MNTMPEPRPCPQCGSPIPAGAAEGLCPRCLLALNLATQSRMEGDTLPPNADPVVPPPTMEEVAKLFPQLEILRLVGTGGMGAVYQARQPALDRFVALKLLHTPPANDPGFAERFAQEARALAKLNHPNIVALYESGQAGGRLYFLMEFVDGVNLRQLQQAGRLSPREALQIVPQVCDALQYAHDEGIVHRDIKPENVLIDRKGRVKVADFGLAKLMGRETASTRLTAAGNVMGTPHYMAPEQVEHPLEVDHRADIFSLGVVFYELLTGELPLGKFPMPSKKVRIDVRLDEVVLKALEKEPALRYGQASELKTRVETIAGGIPQHEAMPQQVSRLEYRSKTTLFGLPLVHIARGFDPETGRPQIAKGIIAIGGRAKGVVAIGGTATGVIALGGVSFGVFAYGGIACGLFSFGGLAVALLAALGGGAVASISLGGGAAGIYAFGGQGYGLHVLDSVTRDPAAVRFFGTWAEMLLTNMVWANMLSLVLMMGVLMIVPAVVLRRSGRDTAFGAETVRPSIHARLARVDDGDHVQSREDAAGKTAASASSAGKAKKKRSLKDWAWRFMPAVAVLLAFFNPWGARAWYWFAAACAVLSVLPSFRLSRWWWPVVLGGVVAAFAMVFPWRDHVRPLQPASQPGTVQNDAFPQLRALAWLDEIQSRPDWAGWIPSGELIRKADMHLPDWITTPTGIDVSDTKAAGDEQRFICLWFSHPKFDAQSIVQITLLDDKGKPLDVPSKEWGSGVSPPQGDTQNLGWITATLCAGRRGHTPDFATVQLRYSAGAWQFGDDLPVDFNGFRALGNGVQLTPPGQGTDGRAFVMLTHDSGKDAGVEQFDFVAILKDGRRLERTGHSDSGSDTVRNERFIFDAPFSQVKTFQIRKRSVRQMTWPVVLRADEPGAAAGPPSDASRDWLALMDKGDYAQSWAVAAESFRGVVTKAKWADESEKIRKPLGELISRTCTTTQQTKTFPGMPDGVYWLAEYDTSFAGLKSASETVTLMREKDGRWRVISYLIRPRTEEERAVVVAARTWLEGIDDGRYAESWSNASGLFRDALSQKKWVEALEEVRRPFGVRVFRTADGCKTTTSLPGVPAGKYVVMRFNAAFSEDKTADVETVTFVQEKDGVWRAAGYFIK